MSEEINGINLANLMVRLPEEMLVKFKEVCKSQDIKMSQKVRQMIRDLIKPR